MAPERNPEMRRFMPCKWLALVLVVLQPLVSWSQAPVGFVPVATVDDASLNGLISGAMIVSFDLAPDGKTLALLVMRPGVRTPLSLVIEEIATKRVIASRDIGPLIWGPGLQRFSWQVIYASDQRYLVVQDFATMQVLDATTLASIRTITGAGGAQQSAPLFTTGARQSNLFACAFGVEDGRSYGLHLTPVQIKVVNVVSGETVGEWAAEDVPQSISADGSLIAMSSSHVQRGVLPVNVFTARGQKIAELTGDFAFKDTKDPIKPVGRVIGSFIGTHEILLTPDEHFDRSGHASGYSLQRLSIPDGRIEQILTPTEYGPTGGMTGSADGQTVLVTSWHFPPEILAQPHAPLPASTPRLLILKQGAGLHIESALSLGPGPKRGRGDWLDRFGMRISSDGSVIAIPLNSGITVLARNPHP
jgi:hypothetical protein